MRISELFDELNQAELDELLDLPVRDTESISSQFIRRRVDRALDEDPAERRIHMKRTYKRVLCAALIAAVLLTGALAAASRLNLLRGWLPDDGIGELVVNTEQQSIENGDLRLTLEESLADETMTYIAYSLTALTDKGQAILDDLQQEEGGQYHWTGEGLQPVLSLPPTCWSACMPHLPPESPTAPPATARFGRKACQPVSPTSCCSAPIFSARAAFI